MEQTIRNGNMQKELKIALDVTKKNLQEIY